jgi:Uma2 family endonuclease
MTAIPLQRDVHYPESDGQPMAETELHREEMTYLIQALQSWFQEAPDVHVGGNLFLYYVQGDPRKFVSPDVYVTKGIPKGLRRVYKLWIEGKPPSLVIEVTSDSTRDEDFLKKKAIYERLGVEEYLLFDPLRDYLDPPFQGYCLVGGRYQPTPLAGDGSLISRTTGLQLRPEGHRLRLLDPATGEPLLSDQEVRNRLAATEKEIARLRRELAGRRPQSRRS